MKIRFTYLLITVILLSINAYAQQELAIIPYPNKVEYKQDQRFKLTDHTVIVAEHKGQFSAHYLKEQINKMKGFKLSVVKKVQPKSIQFINDPTLDVEAYRLDINTDQIKIIAAEEAGWFYGVQSLVQLIASTDSISGLTISDQPRFKWRAYMLDEARHFQGEEFVKKNP